MNEYADRDRSEAPVWTDSPDDATPLDDIDYWDRIGGDPEAEQHIDYHPATASVVHADGPTAPQPSEDTRDGDEGRVARYGKAIWETSRADESTISATGANIVARAVMAVADAEQEQLRADRAKCKRAAKTLGETIDKQCQMILDVTGRHDLVAGDGDGDWGAVWDHAFALKDRAEAAEARADRLAATLAEVRTLAVRWADKGRTGRLSGSGLMATTLSAVAFDLLAILDREAPE